MLRCGVNENAETRPGMTRLSGSRRGPQPDRCQHRLARASLFLPIMAASATACVDAPPTYTAPEQTPPIILGNLVDPPTVSVVPVTAGTKQTLTVPFRSVDAGDFLYAILWHDLEPGQSQEEKNALIIRPLVLKEASVPLDEQQGRAASFVWEANPVGCRTVTMAISHSKNYPINPEGGVFEPGHLPPIDPNDIAQVTWFFDVQASGASTNPAAPTCWSTP